MQNTNLDNAPLDQRTDPTTVDKDKHPATLGKTTTKAYLQTFLKNAGFSDDQIKGMTSSSKLSAARRQALNDNPDWAPINRPMVVTRDGVTRTYESRITPGGSINPRFARRYAENTGGGPGVEPHAPRSGISSATKGDHYHARNLKVSELVRVEQDGSVTSKAKVIGHGVLDMWDIRDPQARQDANVRGAKEVLECAIYSNDRIRNEALNRAQQARENPNQPPPPPVKVTHVSVNLITPSGVRELPGVRSLLPDYQEQTYTKAQFEAFHAHTTEGNGGPTTFQMDDDRQPGNGVNINGNGQDENIPGRRRCHPASASASIRWRPAPRRLLGGWGSVYGATKA